MKCTKIMPICFTNLNDIAYAINSNAVVLHKAEKNILAVNRKLNARTVFGVMFAVSAWIKISALTRKVDLLQKELTERSAQVYCYECGEDD